jgi:hypothetical protein
MDSEFYEVTRKSFYFWRGHVKLRLSCRMRIAMQKMGQSPPELSAELLFRFWTAEKEIVQISDC